MSWLCSFLLERLDLPERFGEAMAWQRAGAVAFDHAAPALRTRLEGLSDRPFGPSVGHVSWTG